MLATPACQRPAGDRLIAEGDQVIVYERHDRMKAVTVTKNAELQNRFGLFPHNEWIGKPFGCRVVGKKGSGFVYLLAPNPELWTLVLPHRTQILYVADISFVVSFLELRPGSIVLESGTGSGSLTTALARAVAPTGHVHTFDFHEQRAAAAREDFERNGVGHVVTAKVRDIQGQGFPQEFSGQVDAVFLDLPQPWLAVPSVASSLRSDGGVCSFSPCIEQVQRTCEALSAPEFTDVRTFEVLLRTYDVRQEFLNKSLEWQMPCKSDSATKSPPHKRLCSQRDSDQNLEVKEHQQVAEGQQALIADAVPNLAETVNIGLNKQVSSDCSRLQANERAERQTPNVMAKPHPEAKGHTGYLTFARRST